MSLNLEVRQFRSYCNITQHSTLTRMQPDSEGHRELPAEVPANSFQHSGWQAIVAELLQRRGGFETSRLVSMSLANLSQHPLAMFKHRRPGSCSSGIGSRYACAKRPSGSVSKANRIQPVHQVQRL